MDRQWTEAISGKKKSSKTAYLRCFRAIVKMTRTGIESLRTFFRYSSNFPKYIYFGHFSEIEYSNLTQVFATVMNK